MSVLLLLLTLAQLGPTRRVPPPVPPTRMGVELLAQRPLVAVASTVRVTAFGLGGAVVRLRVEQALLPADLPVGAELVVLAYDGDFVPRQRDLVYLLPFRRGTRYRLLQRVDASDKDYKVKLAMTRATIALMRQVDAGKRDQACFAMLLGALRSADAWTRGYALGELRFLAVTRRDLFTAESVSALALVAANSSHAEVPPGVEMVTRIAQGPAPSVRSRDPQEASSP